MDFTHVGTLKAFLKERGFKFSKGLGQNFLVNKDVLEKIANTSSERRCGIIEVGSGVGVLTRELACRHEKVVAVEIDRSLIPILSLILKEFNNVKIINHDILKIDLNELIASEFSEIQDLQLVSNLPYYIATAVIMAFLELPIQRISSITVMIQKEVAMRILAKPGTKNYGILSVITQYYANTSIICNVPPHCFVPQPKVSSTVVCLKILPQPKVHIENRQAFFELIKASFGKRRKILANSLSGIYKKDNVINALSTMGLNLNIRGEELDLFQFATLYNHLKNS